MTVPYHLLLGVLAVLLVAVSCAKSYRRLKHIPGPTVAAFTDLWRFLDVWKRHHHDTNLRLHKKHGDVVRLGPNYVSISMPDAIESIYGIGKGFSKSHFYSPWQNIINGKRVPSPVFMQDEALHAKVKRPIAPAYQLSKLVEFEPSIDSTTAAFFTRLDSIAARPEAQPLDFGTWIQYFSFDVIGELTFSRRLGFVKHGRDVEGVIASIAQNFDRNSVLGQMPWVDLVTFKNPLYLKFFAKQMPSPIVKFGARRLQERLNPDSKAEKGDVEVTDPELRLKAVSSTELAERDFLSRFLQGKDTHPDVVDDKQVLAYLFLNINAGADTVTTTLRGLFYHLLRNHSTLDVATSELLNAVKQGTMSSPFPTFSEAQKLPYLQAVIKEALRFHPAISLPLERVVSSAGLVLPDESKTFLPPGTIVGINAWVLHRDPRIFGRDAEVWNPQRWIDADTAQLRRMDAHLFSFGAGKRTCLGRHIAMLELNKIVPALLIRYDMRLADPAKEWKLRNSWIVTQSGIEVCLKRRDGTGQKVV
ncbi:uncharacterized protein A1O9_12588 [Exophiala aquamarina CBS 119918]|uniref:Cytochrome P450 oxidoreductase n=1 Tax=Exophiala aquamarina CBS 119918 TaxID=1182545 RepID=A0A072NU97_9EURO|nr:uncharacterized protein A1O9_12588 [Exophiala aquamarina CBS 119918]KEF51439.1 hypothetical protein A1O9_12588 [Exophiala aquamarina CBS 119918]